ncbi:hypothetical protein [Flocculibacter collagenilyticus]|uniref:hypothetical protein n=1 Tax=Flocculibacter collagenilyticus TaxID=2744479 RepID=UPI0018F6C682|nr:hypothetical protein [Flocculibacter collagenilyticus]
MKIKVIMLLFISAISTNIHAAVKVLDDNILLSHVPNDKGYLYDELLKLNTTISKRGIQFCDLKNFSEEHCLNRVQDEAYVFNFLNKKMLRVEYSQDDQLLPQKLVALNEAEKIYEKVFVQQLAKWKDDRRLDIENMINIEKQ